MIVLLLKITLLLAAALCAQGLLRTASAAMRHLVCALTLLAVGLMPASLLIRAKPEVLRIPLTTFQASAVNSPIRTAPQFTGILIALWLLGAALILSRVLLGHWRVSRIRRQARTVGASGGVPILQAEIDVPAAVGLARPAILLPASAVDWPADYLSAALRHEGAHIDRKDLWTNLFAQIVCAAYWFHPLVWAVARRMREEQELACDDAALTAGTPPDLYAEALLAAARFVRQPQVNSLTGCPMITRSSLKNRIARLVDTHLPRTSSLSSLWRTAALLVIAGAGVALVSADPQTPPTAEPVDGKVYRVGKGVSAPKVLLKVDPEYTDEARDAKIDGTVLLQVVIGADGTAHHINVLRGLYGGLDIKAVEAVQKWKFAPAELKGRAVTVEAQIEINFRLM